MIIMKLKGQRKHSKQITLLNDKFVVVADLADYYVYILQAFDC